jgi:hypothetical protein
MPRSAETSGGVGTRPAWSIQVGAYAEAEQAQRAIQQARKLAPVLLQSAASDVQRVGGAGRDASRIRARLTGLGAATAREACEVLRARRLPCMVVAPAPQPRSLAAAP